MPKKKISKKQKTSKANTSQTKKLNSSDFFKAMSLDELSEVLFQVWMDRDIQSFKEVLSAFLEVHNKQKVAKIMGVSRNTLYHMIGPDGNPTLDTVFKLLDALEAEEAA